MSEVSMNLSAISAANEIRQRLEADMAKFFAKGGSVTELPIDARSDIELPMRHKETGAERKKRAFDKRMSNDIERKASRKRAAK